MHSRSIPWLLALALAAGPPLAGAQPPRPTHTVSHFSERWFFDHLARRATMPRHEAGQVPAAQQPKAGTSLNLLANLNVAACGGAAGWDQGQCGNCWVFGSTAACSIDYGIATGMPQLFSPQWFDSDYYATGGGSACDGGDTVTFAQFYNTYPTFIPWTNSNAAWADGNGPSSPSVPASSIAQSPSVGITGISAVQIVTDSVSQAQAIANIKSVLDANKTVTFSFFLPDAGWNDFDDWWDSASETTPWPDIDSYQGTTEDGGHLVCVVGYDDATGGWILRNSWGTTSGRPDGTFEIPQAMGYADQISFGGGTTDAYEFDYYEITGWPSASTAPAITTQPSSQSVVAGARATFKVAATGSAPLSYQWYLGATAISGATSASYTTPATTAADNGQTFHVVVSNSAGKATSITVTLTVSAISPGGQLILNGGFEAGDYDWIGGGVLIGAFGASQPAHTGTWCAWLGNPANASPGTLWQTVTLPGTLNSATLSFWLHIGKSARRGDPAQFQVQVCNASGGLLAMLGTFTSAQAATGYQQHSYDLSAYKGQTVRLEFKAVEASSRWSAFALDDVSLDVQ